MLSVRACWVCTDGRQKEDNQAVRRSKGCACAGTCAAKGASATTLCLRVHVHVHVHVHVRPCGGWWWLTDLPLAGTVPQDGDSS